MPEQKYILEVYQLNVTTGEFLRIDQITTYKNLSYTEVYNGVGGARFEMAVQDPKATVTNLTRYRNHIAIKRRGGVVWFGPITDISTDYVDVSGNYVIDCNTVLSHFEERFSERSLIYPETTDLIELCADLVTDVQLRTNGDLGITVAAMPAGIQRPRVLEYRSISREIIEDSGLIGSFDFLFVPTTDASNRVTGVVLNFYATRIGRLRRDLNPLELGRNIHRIRLVTKDKILNSSIALGAGTGEDQITSELDFGASQRAYTRRETIQTIKDAQLSSTLSLYNEVYLNEVSVERFLIDLEQYQDTLPQLGTFNIGDVLFINCQVGTEGGYLNFRNRQGRVVGLTVNVDENGGESIVPRLEIIP